MKKVSIVLSLIFAIILLSSFTTKNNTAEVTMVSKKEVSYLLISGKTAIPQKYSIVTVEYNGNLFDIDSKELYDNFKQNQKVECKIDPTYASNVELRNQI